MNQNPYDSPIQIQTDSPPGQVSSRGRNKKPKGIPPAAHVMCGWPLLLALVGGAIGGLMGGIAYGVNLAIYKSNLPDPLKIFLNIFSGVWAVVLWFVAAIVIYSAMQ